MTHPLLDLHLHRKSFGTRLVLQNVRLSVAAGEVVTLVGASGCGKSTLLRIIAGLDADHDGDVHLAGRRLTGLTPDVRFIFQEPRLFPWLTVARNVAFDLGEGGHRDPRVAALLDEVGLAGLGDALPKQLSGGQAQRVAIARGLFTQPRLLLLDEPFSAVDAFTRMKLQDLLLRVAQAHGITLVMVTHDIDEAVHVSDRVLVLDADPGRIAAEVAVPIARPRRRDDPAVPAITAQVRAALQAVHAF